MIKSNEVQANSIRLVLMLRVAVNLEEWLCTMDKQSGPLKIHHLYVFTDHQLPDYLHELKSNWIVSFGKYTL